MIARKKPLRRRSPERAKIEKDLNRLCRYLVVELRDKNTCQRCGATTGKIDWAHIFTRNHKRLQWNPDNSLALCAGCHLWFDRERIAAWDWFYQRFQQRAANLLWQRSDRSRAL